MRWMCMALLLMFSAVATASELWRWVDERGIVHYSDRPHPGAERVELAPAQSYTAPELPPRPQPPRPDPQDEPVAVYSRLSIAAPAEGEMLWNIGGELNVEIEMQPPLSREHELRLYLNNQRVEGVPQGVDRFTIREVFRGEHTIHASIFDGQGRELISSARIRFFVQQASLQNPNRPRPGAGGG
jgi:hypothetical protein